MADFKISQLGTANQAVDGDYFIINKGNSTTQRINFTDILSGAGGGLDERYVVLGGDATTQEITGSGGLKISGMVESGGGIKVTGGKVDDVNTGLFQSASGGISYLNLGSNGSLGVQVGTFIGNPDNQIINLNGRTKIVDTCKGAAVKGNVASSLVVQLTAVENGNQKNYGGYVFADDTTTFTGFSAGDLNVFTGVYSTITQSSDVYAVGAGFYTTTTVDTTNSNRYGSVSYTHLTLPTILLV